MGATRLSRRTRARSTTTNGMERDTLCGRTELTTEALGTGIARAGKEKSSTAQVTHTKVDGAVENLRVSAHTPGPAAASKATSIKAEA